MQVPSGRILSKLFSAVPPGPSMVPNTWQVLSEHLNKWMDFLCPEVCAVISAKPSFLNLCQLGKDCEFLFHIYWCLNWMTFKILLVFWASAAVYSPLTSACTGSSSIDRFVISRLFSQSSHLKRRTAGLWPSAPSSILNIQSSISGHTQALLKFYPFKTESSPKKEAQGWTYFQVGRHMVFLWLCWLYDNHDISEWK